MCIEVTDHVAEVVSRGYASGGGNKSSSAMMEPFHHRREWTYTHAVELHDRLCNIRMSALSVRLPGWLKG